MSKLSWFYIAIIVTGLVFIAVVRLSRSYQAKAQARQAAAEAEEVRHFLQRPMAPLMQFPVFAKITENTNTQVYLEDVSLPDELNKEQARRTISSILDDYRDDENLRAFYADLEKSTGEKISLADLSGERMQILMQRYPQIAQIIERHGQNPAFSQVLQEIFSNPQFVRSVAILQQ